MKPASRERKERFLSSFDAYKSPMRTAITAISERIYRDGLDWLTDEQLSEITTDVLENARSSHRRMMRRRFELRSSR
jgi:hypothetical protein